MRACAQSRLFAKTSDGYLTRLYGSLRARCPESLQAPTFWASVNVFRSWVYQETSRSTPPRSCGWCGIKLIFSSTDSKGLDRQITLDRKYTARDAALGLPGSQEYTPENVVIACRFCQLARNDASVVHWEQYRDHLFASGDLSRTANCCPNAETPATPDTVHRCLQVAQRYHAMLPEGWALSQFLKQNQCSILTPGLQIHCCTGPLQCLYSVSVDRIDNSKGHTVDNVWLTTRGEQFSKRTVRSGEPMTVERWQRCRQARQQARTTSFTPRC